jgi:2-polyprenyl-3-methyl-5-hydroxy-6-metoxy-1,4-benzoquinol methylase
VFTNRQRKQDNTTDTITNMAAVANTNPAHAAGDETSDLSKQYDTPLGLAHTTMQALKDRIKLHYDLASDYYLNLWYASHPPSHCLSPTHPPNPQQRGEHIHHGYWPTDASKASETKETAQLNLIRLLLTISSLPIPDDASSTTTTTQATLGNNSSKPLRILDVGCGVGGTTRFLARSLGATVTGITISSKQVQIATRLSKEAASTPPAPAPGGAEAGGGAEGGGEGEADGDGFIPIGTSGGRVRFIELDAERMGEFFTSSATAGSGAEFDVVWITEALSHFPNKALFFRNAHRLLRPGSGKLVLADWFKAEELGEGVFEADIKPIEGVFFLLLSPIQRCG